MRIIFAICLLFIVAGCKQGIPKDALALTSTPTELRRLSSRSYDTDDEKKILQASASVLQDQEFSITESETKLGLITAKKNRDATDNGEIAQLVLFSVLVGNANAMNDASKDQIIRASVITKKEGDKKVNVRVTFQRVIYNQLDKVKLQETIKDPALYQTFFEKLSKSIFLEGHNI